jgi:hypothetical protein
VKDQIYTDIICKDFCVYYKGDKEALYCGGYNFLRQNLTFSELRIAINLLNLDQKAKDRIPFYDNEMNSLICKNCEFFINDCDYSNNLSGPPCGGYNIIKNLLSKRWIYSKK